MKVVQHAINVGCTHIDTADICAFVRPKHR